MSEDKKTIGQRVLEHDYNNPGIEDDIHEYTRAMSSEIATQLLSLAHKTKDHDLYKNKDFYIVCTKRPDPVLRYPILKYWARRSCPTPAYRQDVYKYYHQTGHLVFLS